MIYRIDAENKILGRVATEIALLLRGKNKADFSPNRDVTAEVQVHNADKIRVTGKKYEDKVYWRYTGYPGGIKKRSYKELKAHNPGLILKKAVYGMLPKNKMRAKLIKKLQIISKPKHD